MADINNLIQAFDPKDLNYQILTHGNVDLSVKGKKGDQYLEVKFQTDPSFIVGKEAIIVWVDKEKFKSTVAALASG